MTIDNVLEILEKHKLHIPSNVFYELKADIVNFEEPTTKDDVPENNVGNIELTIKNDLEVDCIVDVLGSYTDLDIPYKREIAENILIKLPSVTPQEPRKGHWIVQPSNKEQGERDFIWWKCSECGQVIYSETEKDRKEFHAFCSRCGADMREVKE